MSKRYLSKEERDFYAILQAFSFFLSAKVDQLSDKHTNIKEVRQKLRSARTLTEKRQLYYYSRTTWKHL